MQINSNNQTIANIVSKTSPPLKVQIICRILNTTQLLIEYDKSDNTLNESNCVYFRRKQSKKPQYFQEQSQSEQSEFLPQKLNPKSCETKNISTSYGKMIIRFIFSKIELIQKILLKQGYDKQQFMESLQYFSQHMYSVSDLRKLWLDQNNKFAKIYRIFSMNFLRKHSYKYIFHSRIKMHERNLKYRQKIIQGVINPQQFILLKQF